MSQQHADEEEFDEEEDGNDSDNESASSQSEIELEDKPSDAIRQGLFSLSFYQNHVLIFYFVRHLENVDGRDFEAQRKARQDALWRDDRC